MKNGVTPKMPMAMFVHLGAPPQCKTSGCRKPAHASCAFPLTGKREGEMCDRPVCADCVQDYLCPSHKRLLLARSSI